MKFFTKLIPLALLLVCLSFNVDAQSCSYNTGEPNESCGLQGSTWPVSSQTNNIVGCVSAFDRDYYKITASGKTYYVQVFAVPFNTFQGNYLLQMWISGTTLHLKTSPWFSSGASTKVKLYTSDCYNIGNVVYQNGGVAYLTYDLSLGLRTAGPGNTVSVSNDDVQMVVTDDEVVPTYSLSNEGATDVVQKAIAASATSQHRVYPNPASDAFTLEFADLQAATHVTLFDMAGRAIVRSNVNNARSTSINVAELPSGIYMLQIENATGVVSEKIIVE